MSAEQTEFHHRLYNAAEAFYYAGIITSVPFDAANVHGKPHGTAEDAGNAALGGSNRINRLGAPPIVNFGFSIELYIKLLISLSGTDPPHGHSLDKLFSKLSEVSPQASSAAIKNHYYCRGCEEEFIEYIRHEAKVFEEWRYAYEKELLCSSEDTLLDLANAFRDTVRQMYPPLRSVFHPAEAQG